MEGGGGGGGAGGGGGGGGAAGWGRATAVGLWEGGGRGGCLKYQGGRIEG